MEQNGQELIFNEDEIKHGGVAETASVSQAQALYDAVFKRRQQLREEAAILGVSPFMADKGKAFDLSSGALILHATLLQLKQVIVDVELEHFESSLQDLQNGS